LGIISNALAKENITGKIVGEELKVLTMFEWIVAMLEHSNAFIALPGGLSTLEEIFHSFS
jgi:predicted Rossmann-fold nucleotide-binding protein